MNQPMYQIEDIETLMLEKEFHALLPEEKNFVLQHVADEASYQQMRALLYRMIEESQEDENWLEPDPKVKKNLDALFEESISETPIIPFYKRGVFWSITSIAAIFIVGIWLYIPKDHSSVLVAQNEPQTTSTTENPVVENAPSLNSDHRDEQQISPPPPPVTEQIQFTTIEVNEEEVASPPQEMSDANSLQKDDADITPSSADIAESKTSAKGSTEKSEDYAYVHENARYLSGESQLIKDIHLIVAQNISTYRDELPSTFTFYLKLFIDESGKVYQSDIVRGLDSPIRLKTAIQKDMIKLGKFQPAQQGAQSIKSEMVVPVKWSPE